MGWGWGRIRMVVAVAATVGAMIGGPAGATDERIVDAAGDANFVGLAGTPISEPTLDVLSADITFDSAADVVRFEALMAAVGDDTPLVERFEWRFTYEARPPGPDFAAAVLWVDVMDVYGTPRVTIQRQGSTESGAWGWLVPCPSCTVSVDAATSTVTLDVPRAELQANIDVAPEKPLGAGSKLYQPEVGSDVTTAPSSGSGDPNVDDAELGLERYLTL